MPEPETALMYCVCMRPNWSVFVNGSVKQTPTRFVPSDIDELDVLELLAGGVACSRDAKEALQKPEERPPALIDWH